MIPLTQGKISTNAPSHHTQINKPCTTSKTTLPSRHCTMMEGGVFTLNLEGEVPPELTQKGMPSKKKSQGRPSSIKRSMKKETTDIKNKEPSTGARLHLQIHPEHPPAKDIKCLWKELVLHPPGEPPLPKMENINGDCEDFDRLAVAYKRPPNLCNRFSVRNTQGRGRDVSTYWAL